MRISFVNQKGGVGKSTVAALLTAALKAAGLNVAVDDKDPQGSLAYWASKVGDVPSIEQNPEAAFVIIDSPGHLNLDSAPSRLLMSSVVSSADRVVLVSEMSGFSLHASTPTAELVKQFLPAGARAGVLFNQVRKQTLVGQQDMKDLGKTIGLPVFKNWLPLSSAYEQFSSLGWSVVTGAERERIVSLAKEIIS
jgi:chromosome partitioning protein